MQSFRDGHCKRRRVLLRKSSSRNTANARRPNRTERKSISSRTRRFQKFRYLPRLHGGKIWHYAYLNAGLTLVMNGKEYKATTDSSTCSRSTWTRPSATDRAPQAKDIEIAFTHGEQGGGTANITRTLLRERSARPRAAPPGGVPRRVRQRRPRPFPEGLRPEDVRNCIVAAISMRIQEPVFESQTKTKLGSTTTAPNGPALRGWIGISSPWSG